MGIGYERKRYGFENMNGALTFKELIAFLTIRNYIVVNNCYPTYQNIADELLISKTAVYSRIKKFSGEIIYFDQ